MNDQKMTELPIIMASLDIGEAISPGNNDNEEEEESSPKPLRSGLRRRSLPMMNAAPKRKYQEMTELPVIMASLDIGEAISPRNDDEEEEEVVEPSPKSLRCGSRRRSLPMVNAVPKRRCNLKPKKLDAPSEDGEQLLNYYLDKKVNFSARKALETIYEEPKSSKNGTHSYIGATRQRRITFSGISKAKLKKRKSMLRKVLTGSKVKQKRRLSMDEFLTRLQCLASPLNESGEVSPKH